MTQSRYWESKSLYEMSDEEWESLCDRCGRCCLVKLEDEDSNEVYLTNVACKLLDIKTCCCSDYANRFNAVPICTNLKTDLAAIINYLPESCAYRLLYEGKALENWHPLLSTTSDAMHKAGISVSEFAVSETTVDDDELEQHVIGQPGGNNE